MDDWGGLFEFFEFLGDVGGEGALDQAANAPSKLTFMEQYQSLRRSLSEAAAKAGLTRPKTTPTPNWLSDFPGDDLTPMPKHLAKATLVEAAQNIGKKTASIPSEEFALLSGLSVHHQTGLDAAARSGFLDSVAITLQPNDPEAVKTALQESAKRIEETAEKARRTGQWQTVAIIGVAAVALGAVIWVIQRQKQKKIHEKSFAQKVTQTRTAQDSVPVQRF